MNHKMEKVLPIIALFILKASCDGSVGSDVPIIYQSCGLNKKCVPPYLCKDGQINSDGSRVISPRADFCNSYEVCCSIENEVTETISGPKPLHIGCGYRNTNGLNSKVASAPNESEFAEFPWMVAILQNENTYHTGGSILHPKVVLTGADGVFNRRPSDLTVRAGEWDRNSTSELFPHEDRQVRENLVHKNFKPFSFENNVALLILESAFELSPHISPVCLPPGGYNAENVNCLVTGWGTTEYRSRTLSSILKKISLKIVPKAKCEINLQRATRNPDFRLYAGTICAGGGVGKDTCKGDFGSPLVCPLPHNENRYYQVGFVLGGVTCFQEDVPGVYTSTSYVLPWIENEFRAKNFNLTYLP